MDVKSLKGPTNQHTYNVGKRICMMEHTVSWSNIKNTLDSQNQLHWDHPAKSKLSHTTLKETINSHPISLNSLTSGEIRKQDTTFSASHNAVITRSLPFVVEQRGQVVVLERLFLKELTSERLMKELSNGEWEKPHGTTTNSVNSNELHCLECEAMNQLLSEGDSNSKFFQTSIINKIRKNIVYNLKDDIGNLIMDKKKSLVIFSPTSPIIIVNALDTIPLNVSMDLDTPQTDSEITQALKSFIPLKVPGLNGPMSKTAPQSSIPLKTSTPSLDKGSTIGPKCKAFGTPVTPMFGAKQLGYTVLELCILKNQLFVIATHQII
ncbi:hypothetical protein H5410_060528 [Solanum commersonii]|uniref:Uncharacterized protein n=1 Tax=Solanum commersonii TaxID=4109 RepID=A0A9J5W5G6_SOLCO|nr:hypothetical protein H5410_060528 [Solanum commersonii]